MIYHAKDDQCVLTDPDLQSKYAVDPNLRLDPKQSTLCAKLKEMHSEYKKQIDKRRLDYYITSCYTIFNNEKSLKTETREKIDYDEAILRIGRIGEANKIGNKLFESLPQEDKDKLFANANKLFEAAPEIEAALNTPSKNKSFKERFEEIDKRFAQKNNKKISSGF